MIRKKKATQTLKPHITLPPPFGLKEFENKFWRFKEKKLLVDAHIGCVYADKAKVCGYGAVLTLFYKEKDETLSLEQRKLAPWQHLEHILQGVPPTSVLSWDLDRMYLYTLCKVLGSIGRPSYVFLHTKSSYLLENVPRFRSLTDRPTLKDEDLWMRLGHSLNEHTLVFDTKWCKNVCFKFAWDNITTSLQERREKREELKVCRAQLKKYNAQLKPYKHERLKQRIASSFAMAKRGTKRKDR
ncbi:hypothetical protein NHP190003_16190 (plasmid) [Helicobacter sp. NHP19-003]|uniref:Uncharacterized protein n=1 Tax=Helicobacter gastrocanis TaxID=2849641 RepID=A0ABN6I5R2_9HELI|nr:hypothetical protein [Helicobacter sp. NHP19-003]BCZ18337.1 hypothetical protein NHP190003_16190 [Helicobacter sp. NHP19-003]